MKRLLPMAGVLVCAALLLSQQAPVRSVGPQPDGGYLLTTGWMLRPAGRQMPLGLLPMSSQATPDGKFLLVLHGAGTPQTLRAIDVHTFAEVSHVDVPGAWLGLTISANGRLAYVSGGATANIYEVSVSLEGQLAVARTFKTLDPQAQDGGLFLGDLTFAPDQHLLYAADLLGNRILVVNPQSGRLIERYPTGRRPYRILFHPDGKSYFVTSWTDGTLYQYDANNGSSLGFLRLAPHTTDMVWRDKPTKPDEGEQFPYSARIFVAAANTNKIFSVGVTATKEMRLIESADVGMTQRQPLGMTPSALAMNAEQSLLYITCSDANAVAVADVSTPKANVLGLLPVGSYPTSSRVSPDGMLVVLNGLGVTVPGSASFIPPMDAAALTSYTRTTILNRPNIDPGTATSGITDEGAYPTPLRQQPSPIQHVVYIVKGNRTYDDLFSGTAARFGDSVTPNQHKLAKEFVHLTNFWVPGDTAADGFFWSTASIVPDFVQKLWPYMLAGPPAGMKLDLLTDPASAPPTGFLWNQAAMAGQAVRNYGFLVTNLANTPGGAQVQAPKRPVLDTSTALQYRGSDAAYADADRAKAFLQDFADLESRNAVPRLSVVKLDGDRTATAAAVADNDYALGLMIEGLSHSKTWPSIAVFVVESDADGGLQRIENHHSPAFVLSPYTHRAAANNTFYNTLSVLQTIETILGLRPMTQYDSDVLPMRDVFASTSDTAPYVAEKPSSSGR